MGRKNKRKKINAFYPSRSQCITHMWRDFYQPQATIPVTDYEPVIRNRRSYNVRRGDIFFAELGYHRGTSIQEGCRPVLVISNDKGNYHSDTINVIPMTGCFKRPDLPCHMVLYPGQIANRHRPFNTATVLTEQITTISKSALRSFVGRIEDAEIIANIESTLSSHLGMGITAAGTDEAVTECASNTESMEVNHV